MSNQANQLRKILRLKLMKEKTGLSVSSIYNKLNPKSKYFDPTFPKSVRLGVSSIGWFESDVDAWLMSLQRN